MTAPDCPRHAETVECLRALDERVARLECIAAGQADLEVVREAHGQRCAAPEPPPAAEPWEPTPEQVEAMLDEEWGERVWADREDADDLRFTTRVALVAAIGPTIDALRSEVASLREQVRALRDHELSVARAVGIYHGADGHNDEPGPREEVVSELKRLCEREDALTEQVRLLSEASLDLAGVALDRRAPADRSDQGGRP